MYPNKLCTLVFALTLAVSSSMANTVTFGPNNTDYRVGVGGEFNLIPNNGDPDGLLANYNPAALLNGGFETFCIQYGEHINFGVTYEYQISTSAKGPTGVDEVSQGTAWLYSQFAQGVLSGYTYVPSVNRAASAGNLQEAIWYLENEISLTAGAIAANPFLTGSSGAITHFGSLVDAQQDALGAFGVFALNLGSSKTSGWEAQDQLIYRGNAVPDNGTTLAFLGLSLLGLAVARRKLSADC